MINSNKLFKAIEDYKESFPIVWKKEKYKWEAVKYFQTYWDLEASDFVQMLNSSLSKAKSLLSYMSYAPKDKIIKFASLKPDIVKYMFTLLFDESQELYSRILHFTKIAEDLQSQYDPNSRNKHDQDLKAISTYLWLRYPDKYYVYKPHCYQALTYKITDNKPIKRDLSPERIIEAYELYDHIKLYLQKDAELTSLLSDVLTYKCYPDYELNTMMTDFSFFIAKFTICGKKSPAIPSYAKEPTRTYTVRPLLTPNYWWLNANPKIWSFQSWSVGEMRNYTLYNDNGEQRYVFQNFSDAKTENLIICYETSPTKQIVALVKVDKEADGKNICFKKVESLSFPIDYTGIRGCKELANIESFVNSNGGFFRLSKQEFDLIMNMARKSSPNNKPNNTHENYTDSDFLDEVYLHNDNLQVLKNLLRRKKNIILQGAPGVGKTYTAKRLAYTLMGEKDDSRVRSIQFHQNYSYEDFVMGYRPKEEGFALQNGIFYQFCIAAANDPGRDYFFIIDEINRGNMSKIFGELLMLIENGYRGTKLTLAYNGASFSVPGNLYLIGMMNTADRSLAMIDYALRRRFSFFTLSPGFDSDGFKNYQSHLQNETFDKLIEIIKKLNNDISKDESLGKGFQIGHSCFCGQDFCTGEWMKEIVCYDLIPMLEEYWFDDPQKVEFWKNELNELFND